MSDRFSLGRFTAVLRKEFIQLRRDRLTFAMMFGVPLMQIVLFGFAINSDPHHLPTAVVDADGSPYSRAIVAALTTSEYFDPLPVAGEGDARRLLTRGEVSFTVSIPAGFSRQLVRGEAPAILVEADASDPVASGPALSAAAALPTVALGRELDGPLAGLRPGAQPFTVIVHRRYNPENLTQYNIVPGLMGVILTLTLVMMTALAITRERERGTMENLLATPVRPLEVMLGKVAPSVLVGYVQVFLILAAARWMFQVPMTGSLALLIACAAPFIVAMLMMGILFSTLARNQMQAMQMTMFFFLPNILLSGFMFPFLGMPGWAQVIGELLPLTHFLRVVRGILLKGAGPEDVIPEMWPILIFLLLVTALALKRYRQTLD